MYISHIPSASDTSSLTSQIDSIPFDNECTPDSIFFLTHGIQYQAPRGTYSRGGSRQDRW